MPTIIHEEIVYNVNWIPNVTVIKIEKLILIKCYVYFKIIYSAIMKEALYIHIYILIYKNKYSIINNADANSVLLMLLIGVCGSSRRRTIVAIEAAQDHPRRTAAT